MGKIGRPKKYKTSDEAYQAKIEQNKEFKEKHPQKTLYSQYKSKAKNFITKKSSLNDLLELQKLLNKRIKELKG